VWVILLSYNWKDAPLATTSAPSFKVPPNPKIKGQGKFTPKWAGNLKKAPQCSRENMKNGPHKEIPQLGLPIGPKEPTWPKGKKNTKGHPKREGVIPSPR